MSGGGDILLKLSKQRTWIQNKGAKNLINKHGILLTENFYMALDVKISYLAIGEECAVAYGLTCSQACFF